MTLNVFLFYFSQFLYAYYRFMIPSGYYITKLDYLLRSLIFLLTIYYLRLDSLGKYPLMMYMLPLYDALIVYDFSITFIARFNYAYYQIYKYL
jgi:hypothetical protein